MSASPVIVLSSLAAGLMLLGAGSVMILRIQAQQDRLRLRIARVVEPYQRRSIAGKVPETSGVGLAAAAHGIGPFLARLFGFDPALPDHYVLRWSPR